MDMPSIFSGLITFLMIPLQLVFAPIDMLLNQIPGVSQVPAYLSELVAFIGKIPETLVALTGISPFIFNSTIIAFILYMTLSPAIQLVKKIRDWILP